MLETRDFSVRIIPARAGFTPWSTTPSPTTWDHPRSRGVYALVTNSVANALGSSPLARGLRWRDMRRLIRFRIIPARAGFTAANVFARLPIEDHPRSRGVYRRGHTPTLTDRGSSPLARGLQAWTHPPPHRSRIIPARAGFTLSMITGVAPAGDHPRSRGVYINNVAIFVNGGGSSPLARGLPIPDRVQNIRIGIIPARAGFTVL